MYFRTTEFTTSQRKQYINAKQLYELYIEKKNAYYRNYHVSMFWNRAGGKAYLTKKSSSQGKVTSLGAKNEETTKIYEDFVQHKQALNQELTSLKKKLEKVRKLNKIELLTRVEKMKHFKKEVMEAYKMEVKL